MARSPLALEAYEQIAEAYATRIDTKAHNAYYERPATLSLLPEVKGRHVLEAGCGPGVYTEWLVKHGAQVMALDISPKMIALAKKRVGDKAAFRLADLGQPLDFLENEIFDLILSALVLDYIEDWAGVFCEFFRVLRPGGRLVFSIGHPLADFKLSRSQNYFETEQVEIVWRGFGIPVNMPTYRRPFSAVLNPLVEAGFRIEHIHEPTPTKQFKQSEPEDYERLMKNPGFLCVRVGKG